MAGLRSHLPDDLNAKADIASMAHGLEVRSPLLDHELAELAASMPADLKMRNGESKYILKKIAAKHVPRECIYRRKHGFTVPLKHWFRGGLDDFARGVLLDAKFLSRGFSRPGVEGLIADHGSKRADNADKLWALLMLALWFDEWF
jgi:asparagine synthase (glutamine-hydrolysing)